MTNVRYVVGNSYMVRGEVGLPLAVGTTTPERLFCLDAAQGLKAFDSTHLLVQNFYA